MSFENTLNDTFQNKDSNVAKDLKLNFKRYFEDCSLDEKMRMLIAYSLSSIFNLESLNQYARSRLNEFEYTLEQQKEALEISAFMKMLNTYYKFKNFVQNKAEYNAAGLRMNTMAKPYLSKKDFEVLAFAHSLVNSCEFCLKAHEQELKQHGLKVDQIHDIARLVSILGAVGTLNTPS